MLILRKGTGSIQLRDVYRKIGLTESVSINGWKTAAGPLSCSVVVVKRDASYERHCRDVFKMERKRR